MAKLRASPAQAAKLVHYTVRATFASPDIVRLGATGNARFHRLTDRRAATARTADTTAHVCGPRLGVASR